ncbi:hypothetical protein FOZ60_008352 [Perkinsus olseni]|uniref:polynucleotide adenylyltransferase n=1 Tax=Perkinsus olseni TaxID=32597 RepID=A0A7J6NJX7_PEROL|nr:hypothetical protein FOZ60_008352 [Perkinsus olseni]
MLSLVVDTQTFRLATRVIKYWAQQRLIYSNAIGYMGGVSWAVMVGRVCQLYPNYSAKQIVERFFYVYARWQWTATRDYGNSVAVTLCPIEDAASKVYIRQASRDASDNAYLPTHNTTYNVQESNKRVIVREIKRGREIMELMSMNKSSGATKGNEVTWADLCAPFHSSREEGSQQPPPQVYRQFLLLEISAETEKAFLKFKGLVESRVLPQPHPVMFQRGSLGPDAIPGEAPSFLGAFSETDLEWPSDDLSAAAQVSKEMKSACDGFAEHITQAALSDEWDAFRGQFNLTIQHRYLTDLPAYIRPKPTPPSTRHHSVGSKPTVTKVAGSNPSAVNVAETTKRKRGEGVEAESLPAKEARVQETA